MSADMVVSSNVHHGSLHSSPRANSGSIEPRLLANSMASDVTARISAEACEDIVAVQRNSATAYVDSGQGDDCTHP